MSERDDNVDGKFFKIEVPDYDGGGKGSYLRLGVSDPREAEVSPIAERSTVEHLKGLGTDLAVMAAVSGLDHTGREDHVWESNFDGPPVVFQDDRRDWGDYAHLPPAAREAETARLFTKGGWRDHSDGNRITTTRGDKVEVIRGNYKLLVLGRQASLDSDAALTGGEASGFDFSGGVTRGLGINLSEVDTTEVRYDEEGWWTTTKTHNGRTYDRFFGEQHSYFRGTSQTSETGNEDCAEECPDITEKTWAGRIESYTGSFKRPVLLIKDETFAVEMIEVTNAVNIATTTQAVAIIDNVKAENLTTAAHYLNTQEATHVAMSAVTATVVDGLSSEAFSAGTVANQTNVVGPLQENVNAGSLVSLTTAGSALDVSLYATAGVGMVVSPALVDLTVSNVIECLLGTVTSLKAGNFIDVGAGLFTEVRAGIKVGITAGLVTEVIVPSYDATAGKFSFKSPKVSLGNTAD